MMNGDDEIGDLSSDMTERYLLFLRGRGPEPDLTELPQELRDAVREQLEIVAALADRGPEPPPVEEDPVAIRLGLVPGPKTPETPPTAGRDLGYGSVRQVLEDLQFRFGEQIDLEFAPSWEARVPAGMTPVAQSAVFGEIVAVCLAEPGQWLGEPEAVAMFFRESPISSLAITSVDGERAVLITAADAQRSVDPVRGWLPPRSPAPEPLDIALGRHFDQLLPAWDQVVGLDGFLDVADTEATGAEAAEDEWQLALRGKPRLDHKKEGQRWLGEIGSSPIAAMVTAVQERRLVGDELLAELARVSGAGAS